MCSSCIPPSRVVQLCNKVAYTQSCTLYVVLWVLDGGPNSRVGGKGVCDALLNGAHTHRVHFTFLRLRLQKPGCCFPWILFHPLGYHVQGTPLVSLEEWAFSCLPLERSPGFRKECPSRPDLKWYVLSTLSVHSLVVPEPLSLSTFLLPQKSKVLSSTWPPPCPFYFG